MKRHDFTKGINCVDCGQSLDALMTNGCFGRPKPATPEPPEWIDDGPYEITPKFWQDLAEMERKAREKLKAGDTITSNIPGFERMVIEAVTPSASDVVHVRSSGTLVNGDKTIRWESVTVELKPFDSSQWDTPPDPVTDFIARRVAKRKKPLSEVMVDAMRGALDRVRRREPIDPRSEPLTRAMSQPGPHDTPMHTRLMPYRGMNQ